MTSKTATTLRRDPCRSATKNFRNMTAASGPFIDFSLVGTNKYTWEQASVKAFFRRNPTPARAAFLDEEDNNPTAEIPIHTTRVNNATSKNDFPTTADDATPPSPAMALPPLPAGLPPIGSAPPEFFAQLIQTMKSLQAPQLPPKTIVESRDHQESVDLAKLQTSMLKLMYVSGDIDWDEATIKNIRLATFSKGFKNLLDRTASVQVTQLSNLFVTVFTTEPEDDDDDTATNPLNRLMSLSVFPQKFTKAHLNASFQSVDLETGSIYKSTSINPFHYAPQTNRKTILEAATKMDEEQNELNWSIVEKDRSKISSLIEGIGRVNNMEEVAMTCTNICGVQLAMVELQVAVLVEIHEDAGGEDVVEAPDIAQLLEHAVVRRDDFHAGLGKDVRMGEGGRCKRHDRSGRAVTEAFSHASSTLPEFQLLVSPCPMIGTKVGPRAGSMAQE